MHAAQLHRGPARVVIVASILLLVVQMWATSVVGAEANGSTGNAVHFSLTQPLQ
jgi:hypothetical protein